MQLKHRGKISHTLQPISIIPLLVLGCMIVILGSHFFTQAMYNEVKLELQYVASNTIALFDIAYPGDYELRGDQVLRLYKGEADITNDYSLIDRIREDTGLDVTLFYQDTRILTTIKGADGRYFVGTRAAETIVNDVLYTGEAHFYNNALVNIKTYFSYYVPLTNSDDSIVGMLFIGKPRAEVDKAVQRCLYPLLLAVCITIVMMLIVISRYTRSLVNVLIKIRNYVTTVSAGNLDARLSESVLERNDELGEIGFSIQSMHRSLQTMVDQDGLTGLFNRRCANRKLEKALQNAAENASPLCLAIGDIDYFKKINDTYGHACGDIVLKQVAQTMKIHLRQYGFVARWGGEEFLMVLEQSNLAEATQVLEDLRTTISRLEIPYEDQTLHVSITIGIAENDGSHCDNLLQRADSALYEGKAAGRNRVVVNAITDSSKGDFE